MFKFNVFLVSLLWLLVGISQAVPAMDLKRDQTVSSADASSSSSWWMADIPRNGNVAFGSSSDYKIFRNVMDFGATGDGSTDDTAAINSAISSGNRCGKGCDSSTVTPAIVYFPPGTYVVSTPVIQYYYTQLIGDANDLPVIKASPGFQGMAVIDADPYEDDGSNWYTNQNNFFRQVRNFVIDLTAMPSSVGAGIHWQVAQATSLQNMRFEMVQGGGDANKQSGIFMDNGSGGFMTDLTFNGGNYGAFFGSQQFTTRNLTFNGCNTAVYMNWNWLWALKSLKVNNCGVGVDISNGGFNQTVGSATLQDSKFSNTPVGVKTSFDQSSQPATGGTLVIDNVDFTGCPTAVQAKSGGTILAGGQTVASWAQGKWYTAKSGSRVQGSMTGPVKPAPLLTANGKVFERSKPQYDGVPASNFVSVKSKGAQGDGTTDDTAAIQAAMNSISSDQILYFDHGAYVISKTVHVPANIRMTGEIWPLIMAKGSAFQDQHNPQPVFKIGNAGDVGKVEMSDMIFETIGPQPGAIMVEWNVAGAKQGDAAMWDVHFRIGGSAGTQLQSDTCHKNPDQQHGANSACMGAFLLFHATPSSSVYVENSWFWVADHELDLSDHAQIDIYNGRGVLIESQKATWFYGTSAEHSVLYNYAIADAKNVYMSAIQSETPYFQGNPVATTPFKRQKKFHDPSFGICKGNPERCKKAWGLKINKSQDVLIYSAGLYSFYDNYKQQCLDPANCQVNMVDVRSSQRVSLVGLSTKAATNMVTLNSEPQMTDMDNRSNFCGTVALWKEA